MKKKFSVILFTLCITCFVTPMFAAEEDSVKRKSEGPLVFFSEKVPTYEGLALSAFLVNQYALGEWSRFAVSNLGISGGLEYTFPRFLPKNMDMGASLLMDYGITIPTWGSTLKYHDDIRLHGDMFLRFPFKFIGLYFAFQPEIGYGVAFNHAIGQNGSTANGWFIDQYVTVATAFRFMLPIEALYDIEFEFAPIWTYTPEQYGNAMNNFGYRAGISWHITDTIKSIIRKQENKKQLALVAAQEAENKRLQEEAEQKRKALEEEEEKKRRALEEAKNEEEKARLEAELKAAEEEKIRLAEEKKRLEEEARIAAEKEAARIAEENLRQEMQAEYKRVSRNSEMFFGVGLEELSDFTPDGDGVHDTIVFRPNKKYMSQAPESWSLTITDPFGNKFKSWEGNGELPDEIVWDGKGDDGSVVFSRESYTANLSVTISQNDCERLGKSPAEATIKDEISANVGIVLNKTGANEWRIEMASISFDPNAATFNKLSKAQREEFYQTLNTIVEKAQAMDNAKITIEGYANNVSGTDKENTEELIPLSQLRAEAIAKLLTERGIAAEQIKAVGMGGANPKASREDRENWWKNRRIEFVFSK